MYIHTYTVTRTQPYTQETHGLAAAWRTQSKPGRRNVGVPQHGALRTTSATCVQGRNSNGIYTYIYI